MYNCRPTETTGWSLYTHLEYGAEYEASFIIVFNTHCLRGLLMGVSQFRHRMFYNAHDNRLIIYSDKHRDQGDDYRGDQHTGRRLRYV